MIEYLLLGVAIGWVAAILYHFYTKKKIALEWKENEKKLRKSVADSSRRVIKGQIGEHLAPLLSEEMREFDLSDMSFIGAPIDYLIIDGYTSVKDGDGKDVTIVIADVKTGNARLTREQRIIKKACEAGRIRFVTINILGND